MNTSTQSVKVWDPIVRIGHWTLVIAFFTAYFTEDDFMSVHTWAGYVVAAVVVFRIFWGFVGSKHAQFKDFIYSPSAVIAYLKGLLQRKPQHFLGHNPAGGVMVIALLISICMTGYSGMALYAVEENAGPLANIYGTNTLPNTSELTASISLISEVYASGGKEGFGGTGHAGKMYEHESKDEAAEEFWEGLHEFFANFTLFLVILHVGGVILSSRIDKENLVKAMITGRKEIPKD
jgi:cytochrome b